jgi:hypothetical protein
MKLELIEELEKQYNYHQALCRGLAEAIKIGTEDNLRNKLLSLGFRRGKQFDVKYSTSDVEGSLDIHTFEYLGLNMELGYTRDGSYSYLKDKEDYNPELRIFARLIKRVRTKDGRVLGQLKDSKFHFCPEMIENFVVVNK